MPNLFQNIKNIASGRFSGSRPSALEGKPPRRIFTWRPAPVDFAFFLLLTVVFFALPVFMAPDSTFYINNAYVLDGKLDMSAWNTVRGLGLPLILRLGYIFFGESTYGTAANFYLYYLLFIALSLYAAHLLGLYGPKRRWPAWLALTIGLFLNPTVLTYSHFVLTEFFATVFLVAALCLLLKTNQLLLRETVKKRVLVWCVRYGGTALLVVVLYAIKQMFFAAAIILLLLAEVLLWVQRFSLKQIIATVLAVILVGASIPLYATVWEGYVSRDTEYVELYTNQSLATTTLIDGMRYFRTDWTEHTTGEPVRFEIMSNDYTQVLDSFEFSFDGTLMNSLQFVATCFLKAPERALTSWVNNYLVIANVRRILSNELPICYKPVSQTNHFTYIDSSETMWWVIVYKHLQQGSTGYEGRGFDSYKHFPQYIQMTDNGLISNLIFNTHYPVFAQFLYSFTLFVAPFLFLAAFVLLLIFRKKTAFALWSKVFVFAGGIFGYILFLAITACNLDRYGFPITPLCVFLWLTLLYAGLQWLWPRTKKLFALLQKRRAAAANASPSTDRPTTTHPKDAL